MHSDYATVLALIHKDPDSDFGISFPDFPGCASAGKTIADALKEGEEAIALHVEGLAKDGAAFPVHPSDHPTNGAVHVAVLQVRIR